jgi:hypothetical protein
MANDGREENGAGTSMDAVGSSGSGSGSGNSSSNGNGSGSGIRGGEAGAELQSWDQVLDNATPSTSPPYWDTDDDDSGKLSVPSSPVFLQIPCTLNIYSFPLPLNKRAGFPYKKFILIYLSEIVCMDVEASIFLYLSPMITEK